MAPQRQKRNYFRPTKKVRVARLSGKVSSCTVETIEKRDFTGLRFDGSFPAPRLSNVVKPQKRVERRNSVMI
jgi:hypothetical protein